MDPEAQAELEMIKSQRAYSSEVIEDSCDHMGEFETFLDCFLLKILDAARKHRKDQTLILKIRSMNQSKPREDILYYRPSKDVRQLRTQFLELYPPIEEF